ncbi:MAG: DUF2490 domain-containing protein [Cyclobacteriaceae bacterium]
MTGRLLFFCLLSSSLSFGQGTSTHQSLYWIRYYNQTQLSSKYTLHFEVDERRQINPDIQFQLFAHAHLHRRFSKLIDVAAGFTYATTNSSKNPNLAVPEFRPFQEINFSQPISKKIQLQFRYRFDQRFIRNNDKIELTDGYTFSFRHRFRLQCSMTVKKYESGKTIIVKLSDEIMLSQGSNAPNSFDQNRVYAGVEFQFNKKWAVELGYLNQYQSASGNNYFARDIMRWTVFHRLSLLKTE